MYFAINYVPGDMLIPIMETLVFIGRNLDAGDIGRVYFQDVNSYRQGIQYEADESDEGDESDQGDQSDLVGKVFSGSENQVAHIFEYERALDELVRCSLRRRKLDTQMSIRYPERELTDYAEPMLPAELREGSAYFILNYADDDMLIPVMDTRVFIGRNLEADDVGKVYFQDVDSHHQGVRYDPADKDDWPAFYVEAEECLDHTFEFERALEELMRCSLRRRKV